MNELEKMFDIQNEHDHRFIDFVKFSMNREYKIQTVKNRILDIMDQTAKLLNCFGWKDHKYYNQKDDFINIKQQIIDVQKYLIGLANLVGMDADDYSNLFIDRSKTMELIWNNESLEFAENDKVVVFDMDGVIFDYNSAYESYLYNVGLNPKQEYRNEYSYYNKYGITKTDEEVLYKNFIMRGFFSKLKVYNGIEDLFKWIKYQGIKIAIVSARPVWQYSKIIDDTYSALDENRLKPDMVIFNKDKADAIIQRIYPAKVLCFIEDRDKHAIEVSSLGIPVLLIDKEYNRKFVNSDSKIKRIPEDKITYKRIMTYIKEKYL